MNTFSKLLRSSILIVVVQFTCQAVQAQLSGLSDLDPTNPDSGLREGLADLDEARLGIGSGFIRPDDPTYISDPGVPVTLSSALGRRIRSSQSGLSLVPIREEVGKNMSRVCLWNVQGEGVRDQSWILVPTLYGTRIVSAESGLSLVPIRETVSKNFGQLCLLKIDGDGVRDQHWNLSN